MVSNQYKCCIFSVHVCLSCLLINLKHFYGNLNNQSFEEIIKSDKFQKICNYVEKEVNVHKCMPTCRQHNANKYLWSITEEGKEPTKDINLKDDTIHLNFI